MNIPNSGRGTVIQTSSSSSTVVAINKRASEQVSWNKPQLVYLPRLVCCRCSSTSNASTEQRQAAAAPAATALLLPSTPDTGGMRPQQRWNAVCLAYLGDAVWEACLRTRLYHPVHTRQYNSTVASMANTHAQAACYDLLMRAQWLTPEETALMRWATNNSSVAPPAHATRQQYKQATAVETLVAHLYLTDASRLQQLMDWLMQPLQLKQWQQRQQQHGGSQARTRGPTQCGGSGSSSKNDNLRTAKGKRSKPSRTKDTRQGTNI